MGFIGFFVKLIFIPINNIIGARPQLMPPPCLLSCGSAHSGVVMLTCHALDSRGGSRHVLIARALALVLYVRRLGGRGCCVFLVRALVSPLHETID